MKRSTVVISLVLIGSLAMLAQCSRQSDDRDRNRGYAGGGGRIFPFFGRSFGGGGRVGSSSPSVGSSARGGFGGIGAGHAAGS